MELYLQNVRTGETHKLSPDRTLIGTADYATHPVECGPHLAALVVKYPSGWSLFALTDDPDVKLNRLSLYPSQQVRLRKGDLLSISDERFSFISPQAMSEEVSPEADTPPPVCLLSINYPDGKDECRAVDHDLLFGRCAFCHVQLTDTRLSRLNALLACDSGNWYIHNLTRKVIGRNRKAVPHYVRVEDGDELLIGPLVARVELRSALPETTPAPASATSTPPPTHRLDCLSTSHATPTDFAETTDDGLGEKLTTTTLESLTESAKRLDHWLKKHPPRVDAPKGGLGAWLDSQKDRLRRFWYDTPETTTARSLRTAGRVEEAFAVLDRAIRQRPDSPDLLRELYRLYDSLGLFELCYRPLRQIEKLAEARGTADPWVLETLAKVCERLGHDDPSMIDRAVKYLSKLEAATGTSMHREKSDILARRALREGGYPSSHEESA